MKNKDIISIFGFIAAIAIIFLGIIGAFYFFFPQNFDLFTGSIIAISIFGIWYFIIRKSI